MPVVGISRLVKHAEHFKSLPRKSPRFVDSKSEQGAAVQQRLNTLREPAHFSLNVALPKAVFGIDQMRAWAAIPPGTLLQQLELLASAGRGTASAGTENESSRRAAYWTQINAVYSYQGANALAHSNIKFIILRSPPRQEVKHLLEPAQTCYQHSASRHPFHVV